MKKKIKKQIKEINDTFGVNHRVSEYPDGKLFILNDDSRVLIALYAETLSMCADFESFKILNNSLKIKLLKAAVEYLERTENERDAK
ncbi:MAG: hypothetical protein Q4A42_03110 [Tissierellia bacterium]|nr:hypothetical protein [Tissierellia bacterium]